MQVLYARFTRGDYLLPIYVYIYIYIYIYIYKSSVVICKASVID